MREINASATNVGRRRRGRGPLLVLLGLLLLALLEIFVLIQVGEQVGALVTLLLLVGFSVLGVWLMRREGGRAWRELRRAVQAGETPSRQIADTILVVMGGALLVLPGFVTDAVGLLLALPVTRPVFRPLLEASIARRVFLDLGTVRARPSSSTSGGGSTRGRESADEVIEGEIIDED